MRPRIGVVLAAIMGLSLLTVALWGHSGTLGATGLLDSDNGGCTDARELDMAPGSQSTGGLRDPLNFWDFFDVPTGTALEKDRTVSAGGLAGVVARSGANDANGTAPINRNSQPINTAVPAVGYHPAFDRGGSDPEGNVWNLLPPDGATSGGDIAAVVAQFGHTCL